MTPCWKKTKDSKIKDFTVTTYQNQSHLYQILLSWLVSWSFLSSLSLMVKYKIQSSSLSSINMSFGGLFTKKLPCCNSKSNNSQVVMALSSI